MKQRGHLVGRHARRDRHEQPRPASRDGRARHPCRADRRRRPLRARADERGRLLARRRAVRPRHHERVRHDRRRAADRPAPAGRDGAPGQDARRARLDHDGLPAGAREREGRRPLARGAPTRAWRMPSPPPRPSSATPGACCCARRAPSRSCASWSRPHPPRSRRPTPTASPTSCASASRCSVAPCPVHGRDTPPSRVRRAGVLASVDGCGAGPASRDGCRGPPHPRLAPQREAAVGDERDRRRARGTTGVIGRSHSRSSRRATSETRDRREAQQLRLEEDAERAPARSPTAAPR